MYTSEQIKDAAVRAVDAIVRDMRSYPNGIVSNEELLLLAGLRPPPDGCTVQEYKTWSGQYLTFRERWRDLMLERIGRYPATVHGKGFRILEPEENIDYADTHVLTKIKKTAQKGLKIIRGTRASDLDDQGKRKRIAAELRMSQVHNIARSAHRQSLREREFRNEPNPSPQAPPSMAPNKQN